MNWIPLTDLLQLDDIKAQSMTQPVVIFKHSTRCSISTMAMQRLERPQYQGPAPCYYLDLIKYRDISNAIADVFQVHHESPQVLLIVKGQCVYEESHNGIHFAELSDQIEQHMV